MTASAARLEQHGEVDEAEEISSFLREHPFPSLVKGFDLELGEDWLGEAAAYVWLLLDEDFKYGSPEMKRISEFARHLRKTLLQRRLRRWPYVSFRVRPKDAASTEVRRGEST